MQAWAGSAGRKARTQADIRGLGSAAAHREHPSACNRSLTQPQCTARSMMARSARRV